MLFDKSDKKSVSGKKKESGKKKKKNKWNGIFRDGKVLFSKHKNFFSRVN